jgi:hypothetical protein
MNWQRGRNKTQRKKLQSQILDLVEPHHGISESQRMVEAGTRAIRAASQRAWKIAGYALIVEGNAVLKVERDGKRTKVSEIESIPRPEILILD